MRALHRSCQKREIRCARAKRKHFTTFMPKENTPLRCFQLCAVSKGYLFTFVKPSQLGSQNFARALRGSTSLRSCQKRALHYADTIRWIPIHFLPDSWNWVPGTRFARVVERTSLRLRYNRAFPSAHTKVKYFTTLVRKEINLLCSCQKIALHYAYSKREHFSALFPRNNYLLLSEFRNWVSRTCSARHKNDHSSTLMPTESTFQCSFH